MSLRKLSRLSSIAAISPFPIARSIMVSDDSLLQYRTSLGPRARLDHFSSLQTSYDDGWGVEGQFVHTSFAEPSRSDDFKVSSTLVAIKRYESSLFPAEL